MPTDRDDVRAGARAHVQQEIEGRIVMMLLMLLSQFNVSACEGGN